MSDFKLKRHSVKAASFNENREKEKKKDIEVGVEGAILIPKDYVDNKDVMIHLKLHFGTQEERIYLTLETLSVFEPVSKNEDFNISEEIVQNACLPIALAELRKTIKKVTEAYGLPPIDLPPFAEENLE